MQNTSLCKTLSQVWSDLTPNLPARQAGIVTVLQMRKAHKGTFNLSSPLMGGACAVPVNYGEYPPR